MRAGWLLVACTACRANFDARVDAPAGTGGDACTPIGGLLAYFPMEPGDIAGNVLRDRSGNGHDGTIIGTPAPALAPGQVGSALDFTATTTAYVDVGGLVVDQSGGAAVTVMGWVLQPSATANEVVFDFPPPNIRYDVWMIAPYLCVNTQNGECWGETGAFTGHWLHVAAILRNGLETGSALYVAGQAQPIGCSMATCANSRTVMDPLRMGAADGYAFHGMLDEVRVYDRALSDAEIAALASGATCL
ncbi:MAG: LamG-like jellyroll fold domain-containing protein [Acidobacteriota bacterium]